MDRATWLTVLWGVALLDEVKDVADRIVVQINKKHNVCTWHKKYDPCF